MVIFDTCIRAFVKGNFGDDLFVITLCNRYPNTKFVMCGEKKYQSIFESLPNLKYVTMDTFINKWLLRLRNIVPGILNRWGKRRHGGEKYAMCRWSDFLARHSRRNILISGSIFMELGTGKFGICGYYKNEIKYYDRHPYVIGCNFGPYHNEEYRQFYTERFQEAEQVCFRESYSCGLFPEKNFCWAPDILFRTDKELAVLPEERDYILVSVVNVEKDGSAENGRIQSGYMKALEYLIDSLLKKGERIVLVGFCNAQGDNEITERLMDSFRGNQRISAYNYPEINYRKVLGYIANAKAVVASRYHAMILGWLWEKKVLPIIYSSKMLHVIEDLAPESIYVTSAEWMEDSDIFIKKYEKVLCEQSGIRLAETVAAAAGHFEKLDVILN